MPLSTDGLQPGNAQERSVASMASATGTLDSDPALTNNAYAEMVPIWDGLSSPEMRQHGHALTPFGDMDLHHRSPVLKGPSMPVITRDRRSFTNRK